MQWHTADAFGRHDARTAEDGEQQAGTVASQIETGLADRYWIGGFDGWEGDERVVWKLR